MDFGMALVLNNLISMIFVCSAFAFSQIRTENITIDLYSDRWESTSEESTKLSSPNILCKQNCFTKKLSCLDKMWTSLKRDISRDRAIISLQVFDAGLSVSQVSEILQLLKEKRENLFFIAYPNESKKTKTGLKKKLKSIGELIHNHNK